MYVKIGPYLKWDQDSQSYDAEEREVDVRIDDYDTWNVDHTLALIILPLLKRYKELNCGSPLVNEEDVPVHMRDKTVHEKWDWVIDEIIWSFEQIVNESDCFDMGHNAHNNRIEEGLCLFGKYYRGIWS